MPTAPRRRTTPPAVAAARPSWPRPPAGPPRGVRRRPPAEKRPPPPWRRHGPRGLDRPPAEEVDVRAELAGKRQPRRHRPRLGRQLTTEGPVALLQPHRLDGVVAGGPNAEPRPGAEEVVVDAGRQLGRHVELPAQLADVRDAGGPHERGPEADLTARAEREGRVVEGVTRARRQG